MKNNSIFKSKFSSIFSWVIYIISIKILVFVLMFIYQKYENFMYSLGERKEKRNEHLTMKVEKPVYFSEIDITKEIQTNNAYITLKKEPNPYVLYTHTDDDMLAYLILFMNRHFMEKQFAPIYILSLDEDEDHLIRKIMSLIPDFEDKYNGTLVIEKVNDFSELGARLMSEDRVLMPFLYEKKRKDKLLKIDEIQERKRDILEIVIDIQIFDYISAINSFDKIKAAFPLSKIGTIHMNQEFPSFSQFNFIYKFISFDQVSIVNKSAILKKNDLDYLQKYYYLRSQSPQQDLASLHFYEKMGYHIHSPKHLDISLTSIENFEDNEENEDEKLVDHSKNIKLIPERNILLKFTEITSLGYKKAEIDNLHIEKIQVNVGDEVQLKNQKYQIENGTYYVTEIKRHHPFDNKTKNRIILENALLLSWNNEMMFTNSLDINNAEYKMTINLKHPDIENVPGRKFIIKKGGYVFIKDPVNLEGFIVKIDKLSNTFDIEMYNREINRQKFSEMRGEETDFECYGYPKIQTKEACHDPFTYTFLDHQRNVDSITEIQRNFVGQQGTWDRRCKHDFECPFFQVGNRDKLGRKYRGGCDNGYCELPLGVQRKSYRQYHINSTSFPFCENCTEFYFENMKNCCMKQLEKKETENSIPENVYLFPQ